jgi:branched-subunit amino acid aminotransferase/4-amino-4-deoxychorismate lyase
LKTLNCLPSVLAQRQATRLGCPEALLTDQGGRLLEGSVSNVFLVDGEGISTPAPAGDFLPGLTRQRILKIAGESAIPIREKDLQVADLDLAREVFVASSVREVLPVVGIHGRTVADGRPGPVTRAVQDAYRRMIRARLGD